MERLPDQYIYPDVFHYNDDGDLGVLSGFTWMMSDLRRKAGGSLPYGTRDGCLEWH